MYKHCNPMSMFIYSKSMFHFSGCESVRALNGRPNIETDRPTDRTDFIPSTSNGERKYILAVKKRSIISDISCIIATPDPLTCTKQTHINRCKGLSDCFPLPRFPFLQGVSEFGRICQFTIYIIYPLCMYTLRKNSSSN